MNDFCFIKFFKGRIPKQPIEKFETDVGVIPAQAGIQFRRHRVVSTFVYRVDNFNKSLVALMQRLYAFFGQERHFKATF